MKRLKIIVIIFVIFWLALSIVHVQAAGILQDNFNSYSDGSIIGKGSWQNYYNGDNWIIQETDTFEGTKALYSNSVADNVIYKGGTLTSDGKQAVYIKTKSRSGWHSDSGFGFRLSKGYPGTIFVSVDFKKDGGVRYYNGSTAYNNFATYNDNEWTLLEVEWRSSDNTARYRVNNSTWTNWYTFAGASSFNGFDHVGLDFYLPSGTGEIWVDNIFSTVPPPTLTPTPTPTPTPEPTQAPTPTPTAVPTRTPTPIPLTPRQTPPPCYEDTWSCSDWGLCSSQGLQTRSCRRTFDCPDIETAPPITNQYCEAPNRPSPQAPPQDNFDDSSIQDSIIKSTVKLLCPFDARRASQGSGTVIDPSGVVLTNKHVVEGTLGCLVGFVDDFNDEPYFGERQIADIVKMSANDDVAVLKIRNPQNRKLNYIDIIKSGSRPRLGAKISIYGYPAKFGTNITYTSGDFSGTDGSYYKTTAILEHGNSGGGAYLKDGVFVGIPSAVVRGQLNALGYILSVNKVNTWLGNPSSFAQGGGSNNRYSRVSVLEDINLNKLDSLEVIIPGTKDAKEASKTAKAKSTISPKPSPSQIQELSPTSTPTEIIKPESKPNPSLFKRFFLWIANIF